MVLLVLILHAQAAIDQVMIELDGTANKAKLGANAILAVSQWLWQKLLEEANLPLYQIYWWYQCKNIAYANDEHCERWCSRR
jgi:enolase